MAYSQHMSISDESEQQTARGETIPVPTRKRVFDDLRKVAKAPEPPSVRGSAGSAEDQP